MAAPHPISLSVGRTTRTLLLIAGALTLLHVVVMLLCYEGPIDRGDWYYEVNLFDLDEEESWGTWYSAMLLLLAGQLLLMQGRASRGAGDGLHRWWRALGWGFHVLSIDEIVGIHEYVNTVQDTPWTTYGYAVAGVVGLAFIPFLVRVPARTRHLFIISGAIYLGGAVMLERATDWYETAHLLNTLKYNLLTALEESMEMGGVILFLYALLGHMAGEGSRSVDVAVEITRGGSSA